MTPRLVDVQQESFTRDLCEHNKYKSSVDYILVVHL